jgi:hypothetical protein
VDCGEMRGKITSFFVTLQHLWAIWVF